MMLRCIPLTHGTIFSTWPVHRHFAMIPREIITKKVQKKGLLFMQETTQIIPSVPFEQATGHIDYQFTNDYMFRAILQKNERVLRALICALLHLEPEDIRSIVITNPIKLGEALNDKDFILDITMCMNNDISIDLEMQVRSQIYWCERSLSYLCRCFDQLYSGENYSNVGPAIHIGFLDFTPFEDVPEFYATYKMLNVKNHNLYSDKFILSVVDLTHIDLATEEDKAYQIDRWARLFKATTWEELRMIAKNNASLLEASKALYSMNADETTRAQCRAREDYERLHNTIRYEMHKLSSENERLSTDNERLTSNVKSLTTDNEKLSVDNEKLVSEVEGLKKLLQDYGISYTSPSE
jgi:predicted transposase/invertase (TIGR01784 family)